jgi:FMN phosphatase YigB (HAD superfamily)
MNCYIFDLDYTLYSKYDVNDKGTDTQFYNSFKRKPLLSKLIKQLTGAKFIFTNGNKIHLDDVLKKMKIKSIFKNMAHSDEYNNYLKPHLSPYFYVHNKFQLNKYNDIYFFEDSIDNLKTAKMIGWKTVWIDIGNSQKKFKFVDFTFQDVESALIYFNFIYE